MKNEEKSLPALLEVAKFIGFDEIVIVDTGSTDRTPDIARRHASIYREYTDYEPIYVDGRPCLNDFAAARNYARICSTTDYIFFLDADDSVYNPLALRQFIDEYVRTGMCDGFFMYYDYEHDDYGNCTLRHLVMRCGTRLGHVWRSPIHEVLTGAQDPRKLTVPADVSRVVHLSKRRDQSAKNYRNARVAEHWIKRLGEERAEPRLWLNYGKSLFAIEEYERAIEAFHRYCDGSGWNLERAYAFMMAGDSYFAMGLFESAIEEIHKALRIAPLNKHAHLDLARCYLAIREPKNALKQLQIADIAEEDGYQENPVLGTWVLPRLKAMACFDDGRLEEAMAHCLEALKANPFDQDMLEKRVVIGNMLERDRLVRGYKDVEWSLSRERDPEKMRSLHRAVPRAIENEPEINVPVLVSRKRRRIAIYCGETPETWGARSADAGGIGGSETAVIHMSRCLTECGWAVEVYGYPAPEDEGLHDGVLWVPHWRFQSAPPADVFISWRIPAASLWSPESRTRYVWLHDLQNGGSGWRPEFWEAVDGVMFLSKFHRKTAPNVPEEKVFYTSNALSRAWHRDGSNLPDHLIYASNPDRDLDLLLRLWPRIREARPTATLDIYYGFTPMFMEAMRTSERYREIYESVMTGINQPGVTWHGRVDQNALAGAFAASGLWVYPTSFGEISPVRGDTVIETCAGPRKIQELVGKKNFHVYSIDSTGNLSISLVRSVFLTRKNTRMVKITAKPTPWSRKRLILHCTPDHEIMLRDGSYRRADELRKGDSIKIVHMPKGPRGYDCIWATDTPCYPRHRLVASLVFGEGAIMGKEVHHKDGNVGNNEPTNLEVLTPSQHRSIEHRIKRRPYRGGERWVDSPWRNQALLYELYVSQGLSTVEIAQKLGCRANTVSSWLHNFGIPVRSASEAQIVKNHGVGGNHVVVNVEEAEPADGYCMEVEPHHNFVANRIVVHNCITAMQAQVTGAVPVCSRYGALDETVQHGIKVGSPTSTFNDNPGHVEEWLEKLIAIIGDKEEQCRIRKDMIPWARKTFLWSKVAEQWTERFLEDLRNSSKRHRSGMVTSVS